MHFLYLSNASLFCVSPTACIVAFSSPKNWIQRFEAYPLKKDPFHAEFPVSLRLIRDVCVGWASVRHVWNMLSSLKWDVWSEGPLNELWLLTWSTLTSSEPAYISIDRHDTALNDLFGSLSFFPSLCIINVWFVKHKSIYVKNRNTLKM